MLTSGRAALIAGVVLAVSGTGCGGNPSPTGRASIHLSAEGANFLGAESRMMSAVAVMVGRGSLKDGSRTSVNDSDHGVVASEEVWFGKSLQTAKGFTLGYSASYSNKPGAQHILGDGNLFIAYVAKGPSLASAASTLPAGPRVLIARRPSLLLDVSAANGTGFDVGFGQGGRLLFNGNDLTYTASDGAVVARHTFDASDDLENRINGVISASVPPPSAALVTEKCGAGAPSVADARAFYLDVGNQNASSTGAESQYLLMVRVTKTSSVDCTTKQATTQMVVDVEGQIGNTIVVALWASPPTPAATPDDGPVAADPPFVTFSLDPADANLLPPDLLPPGSSSSSSATLAPTPTPTPTPAPATTFDGTYTGSNSRGGPLVFTVSNNTVSVAQPAPGSGTVDAGGAVSFNFAGNIGGRPESCHLSGSIQVGSGGQKNARGTASCNVTGVVDWTAIGS